MAKVGGPPQSILEQSVAVAKGYAWRLLFVSGVINLLTLALPIFTLQIFDRVLSSRSYDTLAFLAIAATVALVTMSILDGLRSYLFSRVGDWWARLLAPEVLVRSIEARLTESRLRTELIRELHQVRGFVSGPALPSLLDLPFLPLYVIVAFLIHVYVGVICVVGVVLLVGMSIINERATRKAIHRASQLTTESMHQSDALIRNAEVIDSMGMTDDVMRGWREGLDEEAALNRRVHERSSAIVSTTRLIRALLQITLFATAALLVISHQMTPGAMIAGSIIMGRLLSPIESLLVHWRAMLTARDSFDRLRTFFATPPKRSTETSLPAPSGRINVERIVVALPGSPMPVLRAVDFALAAGEHLAVIGPAASGKTTLVRTLIGILKPNSGVVRLDGVDVYSWRRDEFGRHVGYLPQDVELFRGTVAQNIARFRLVDDAEIIEAARLAGCHDMIVNLPDAYDTEIGESGMLLSGGQRQQVALARALFGRPRYVILDEPNSNLDVRGDLALKSALARMKKLGVTVIIVTHRQSVITQMDKLLVLQAGSVRAFGPTRQVLAELRAGEQAALPPKAAPGGAQEQVGSDAEDSDARDVEEARA